MISPEHRYAVLARARYERNRSRFLRNKIRFGHFQEKTNEWKIEQARVKEVFAGIRNIEMQQHPFTSYYQYKDLFGEETLPGIVQKTIAGARKDEKQVLLVMGPLTAGKTTLCNLLHNAFVREFGSAYIASPTAEEGLEPVTAQTGHTSGTYTAEDYNKGTRELELNIRKALQDDSKKIVLIEVPGTAGMRIETPTPFGKNRGTEAIYKLFGPHPTAFGREMLTGVIGLSASPAFLDRRKARIRPQEGPGGSHLGTLLEDAERRQLLTSRNMLETEIIQQNNLADLAHIPRSMVDRYDIYRREVTATLMDWLFREYYMFPRNKSFIGMSISPQELTKYHHVIFPPDPKSPV